MIMKGYREDKRHLCFVVFIFIYLASCDATLSFVTEPQSVTVKSGSGIELVCLTESREADIRWRLNGSPFTSDLTKGIIVRAGQLQITNVTASYVGTYDCVANNSRGAIISQPADVRIAELQGFQAGLKDLLINVTEGNVALIPCSPPQGIPQPTVSFEFNGRMLDGSSGRYFVLPSNHLQIKEARVSDQGEYRCVAVNPVSGERVLAGNTIQLRVIQPLTPIPSRLIYTSPEKVEVVPGQLLTLECVVEGSPVPVVTWYKYGSQLPEGRFEQHLGNLFIHNVNILDHGSYICRAEHGSPHPQAAVTLVEVLEHPNVRLVPSSQQVTEESSVRFDCHAHGKPKPYVKWLHNGEDVGLDVTITYTDSSLTIRSAQYHHAGYYQCVATSRLGVVYSTATLEVLPKNSKLAPLPSQPRDKPLPSDSSQTKRPPQASLRLHVRPTDTVVMKGDPARLYCMVPAYLPASIAPPVFFTWLKDGLPLSNADTSTATWHANGVLPDGSLQLSEASSADAGLYTCVAVAGSLFDYASARLTVSSSGRPKSNTPAADDQATMSDMSDGAGAGAGAVNNDIVEEEEEEEDAVDYDAGGPVDITPIDGQKVKKKPSEENKVLVPPTKPEVMQKSDTSVLVRWTVPENNGLRITFFRIQYKDVSNLNNQRKWQTLDHDIQPTAREYEVTNLDAGASYKFRVMAVYSNNDNRPSETSIRITLETGGGSIALIPPDNSPLIVEVMPLSLDSLSIRWQYTPSGLMPIEGFYIYYKLYSFPGHYQREQVIGSQFRYHVLRGLQPGAEYSLRMQCFNMAGEGEYSNTVVKRTLASHEVNDDGHIVGDYDPSDRWSSSISNNKGPLITPPNKVPPLITPPTQTIGDRAPVEGQQGNDTLYLILGIVLGVMVIVLLIFVVMCGMRQVNQRKRMAAMQNGKFYETAPMMHHNAQLVKHNPQFPMNGFYPTGQQQGNTSNSQTMMNNSWLSGAQTADGRLTININPMSEIDNSTLRTVDSKAYQTIQSLVDQPINHLDHQPVSPAPPPLPQPRPRPGLVFPSAQAYGSTSSGQSNVSYNVLDAAFCNDNGGTTYQLQQQQPPPHIHAPYMGAFSSFHPRGRETVCNGMHHQIGNGGGDYAEHIYSGSTCGDGCEPLAGEELCMACQECPDCCRASRNPMHHRDSPPAHSEHTSVSSRSSIGQPNAAALVLQNIDNATRERNAGNMQDMRYNHSGGLRMPAQGFNPVAAAPCFVAPYKSAHSQSRVANGQRRLDFPSVNDYSASDDGGDM